MISDQELNEIETRAANDEVSGEDVRRLVASLRRLLSLSDAIRELLYIQTRRDYAYDAYIRESDELKQAVNAVCDVLRRSREEDSFELRHDA